MSELKQKQIAHLHDFYYQITHLLQKKNIESCLKNIIEEINQSMASYNVSKEGLCKVYTYPVTEKLKEQHIPYQKINTKKIR